MIHNVQLLALKQIFTIQISLVDDVMVRVENIVPKAPLRYGCGTKGILDKKKRPASVDLQDHKKSSSDGIRTRVSALRGPRPRPLDNGARKRKAGELGFEPRQYESES